MDPTTSVTLTGDLGKPVSTLIGKIADAIGVLFEPTRIIRKAKAEAKAKEIMAVTDSKIEDQQEQARLKRAMQRFIHEETQKQDNIENIIEKALPYISENAPTEKIEKDWIIHFFDRAKLISDDEMQILWSKILSGESNNPGRFSIRTINIVSELDKRDAILFTNLCRFCVKMNNDDYHIFVYDINMDIYKKHSIDLVNLTQLENLGLINISLGYFLNQLPNSLLIEYYGHTGILKFQEENNNSLNIGTVFINNFGSELLPLCDSEPDYEIFDYLKRTWEKRGLKVIMNPDPK